MIYLDNAATTLVKPYSVIKEVDRCLKSYCANPGRGGHKVSIYAGEKVFQCRENLARLFGIDRPDCIVFTGNTTMALNIGIKGVIDPNSHVVISGMEHNSVLRPVAASCAYSVAPADADGMVSAAAIEKCIRPETKLVVVTHASNITGTINPIKEIAAMAKRRCVLLMVDCAQSAGVIPLNIKNLGVDMIAFAGHKTLYGPTGTGGLYVRPGLELKTIIEGGTGSMSESVSQPSFLPDRLECGTLNTVGIAGLNEGVKFVLRQGEDAIYQYEAELTAVIDEGLKNMPRVTLYGGGERVGICGFAIDGVDSVTAANILDGEYGIASRGGFHCAALAHQSIGTAQKGMVRLSVSYFTKMSDVVKAVDAVWKLCKSH